LDVVVFELLLEEAGSNFVSWFLAVEKHQPNCDQQNEEYHPRVSTAALRRPVFGAFLHLDYFLDELVIEFGKSWKEYVKTDVFRSRGAESSSISIYSLAIVATCHPGG